MRAVAFRGGALVVEDRPEPEAGPGEVVVDVARCGICGSDLHLKRSGFLPEGAVMGHEFAGTVVGVGDGVTDRREGDRVSVLPSLRCDGTCDQCRRGRSALCSHQARMAIGLGAHPGAYAERCRVPASSCFPLPDGMTFEQGALVEPYAVGLHAVRRSRAAGGAADDRVAVLGAGPVGLMTLAALLREGVDDIVVAEPSPTRARAAEAFGASEVVTDAARITGDAPAVVFDCTGVASVPSMAVQSVRGGGQVVLVGVVDPAEAVAIPGALWIIKEVDVATSLGYETAEFAEAVEAVHHGAVDAAAVVSDVRPLEGAEESFAELSMAAGPIKILLAAEPG